MGRYREPKWLAFSLYPLSFFLYSPFKIIFSWNQHKLNIAAPPPSGIHSPPGPPSSNTFCIHCTDMVGFLSAIFFYYIIQEMKRKWGFLFCYPLQLSNMFAQSFNVLIIHKTINMSTLWKEFETFYDELKIGFTQKYVITN